MSSARMVKAGVVKAGAVKAGAFKAGMLTGFVPRLLAIGVCAAAAVASPASATILNTATQTQSYGTSNTVWTHTFSFAPFVSPGPGTALHGVSLAITGTQQIGAGNLTCYIGSGGFGHGTQNCDGTYRQQATFTLKSSPLTAGPPAPLVLSQNDPVYLVETNYFAVSPFALSTAMVPGATASGSYVYYNTVTGSGGTLNPALFTGPGNVNFTFDATALSELSLFLGGAAGIHFSGFHETLTAALTYDFTSTPEPGALALFAIGAVGVVLVRRRAQAV